MVTDDDVAAYARDGAVLIRGLWKGWVEVIAAGIARNMAEPFHNPLISTAPSRA